MERDPKGEHHNLGKIWRKWEGAGDESRGQEGRVLWCSFVGIVEDDSSCLGERWGGGGERRGVRKG